MAPGSEWAWRAARGGHLVNIAVALLMIPGEWATGQKNAPLEKKKHSPFGLGLGSVFWLFCCNVLCFRFGDFRSCFRMTVAASRMKNDIKRPDPLFR